MYNSVLIHNLNKDLHIELPQYIMQDELQQKLSEYINHLIQKDFQKLVDILYKTDVSESRLKMLLRQNSPGDAAQVIARLIIERELQKIQSRNQFSNKDDIPENEKW